MSLRSEKLASVVCVAPRLRRFVSSRGEITSKKAGGMLKSKVLPIDKIYVPVKRRQTLDPLTVRRIAESMLQNGQETPIMVREDGERFVLVEGLHRLEACRSLGEQTVEGFL